jgi:hypothetical protein
VRSTCRIVAEAKRQLRQEADYLQEADHLRRYRRLLAGERRLWVPRVHADLTTKRVLAMDWAAGHPVEDLADPGTPAARRDAAGELLQRLLFRELFEFHFVQTDPNFANYLYDGDAGCIRLLDLGSAREYAPAFVACYAALCRAIVAGDREAARRAAVEIGYLRDEDPPERARAAVELVFLMCEPFRKPGVYDFARSTLAARARDAGFDLAFRQGFLRAPPPETVFMHRKLVGTFLLCARIRARVDVRRILLRSSRARSGPPGARRCARVAHPRGHPQERISVLIHLAETRWRDPRRGGLAAGTGARTSRRRTEWSCGRWIFSRPSGVEPHRVGLRRGVCVDSPLVTSDAPNQGPSSRQASASTRSERLALRLHARRWRGGPDPRRDAGGRGRQTYAWEPSAPPGTTQRR